jgi:TatD DNase family protein
MSSWAELPPLDCHAHISTDVTAAQVAALGGAQLFGMTRSLSEASAALTEGHLSIVWACGVHPGLASAIDAFDARRFESVVSRFAVVGEVGLDRRAGRLDRQQEVLSDILRITAREPVLISIHSAGATGKVLDLLERHRPAGPILHWFLGGQDEVTRAAKLGAFFSANASMPLERLGLLPVDRVLPETDFPSSKGRGGRRPGDVLRLEQSLAQLWSIDADEVRRRLYRNLKRVAMESGAIDRLPEHMADLLLAA